MRRSREHAHPTRPVPIQSSTGRLALPSHPEVALGALEAIELSSRDATRELRQLLGVLRHADSSAAGLFPSPGLGDLEPMLDAMRSAGVHIRLGVDGAVRPLPQGVDLVAYRVVQEALTNVVKHAAAASVEVAIRYRPSEVLVEVRDDGGGGPVRPVEASGHGMVGMRERVASVGGEFAAGPGPGGGFRVTALLPTSGEAP